MHSLGRRHRYGAAGLALVAGLVVGSTGGAYGLDLGGLLGGTGTTSTSPAATEQPSGSLHMARQHLRKGCHPYTYSYAITVPPEDDFDLEIFLTDPHGTSQASDVILSGADGDSGVKRLTICRSNTTPGRFTLHGTLYTNDGAGPTTSTPLPDAHAKLTKHAPGAHKKHHKHKKRHH